MNSHTLNTLISAFALSCIACSSTPDQPDLFTQASMHVETPRPPAVVVVPKVMPMPGQLKVIENTQGENDDPAIATGEVLNAGNNQARVKPTADQFFNAITQFDYEQGALYQIYTAPKRITDIALAPGERLMGKPAGGDTVRWELGVTASGEADNQRVHVLVKPIRPGLRTNLALHTNRRTYLLELHAFKNSYMASVSWQYPQETIKQLTLEARAYENQEVDVLSEWIGPTQFHFDYRIRLAKGKAPSWIPLRVFDDGRKTYIQFPDDIAVRESPALFVLSSSKKVQLVNYRMKGTYYIVDRLFDNAELRLGEKAQTVVSIRRESRPSSTHRR